MRDQRLDTLAKNLLEHSLAMKRGEKLLISAPAAAKPLVRSLVELAYEKELLPFVRTSDEEIRRWLLQGSTEARQRIESGWDIRVAKEIDAHISIAGEENDAEFSGVSPDIMQMRSRVREALGRYDHQGKKVGGAELAHRSVRRRRRACPTASSAISSSTFRASTTPKWALACSRSPR